MVVGVGDKKGGFIIRVYNTALKNIFLFFFHRDYVDDGAGADECKSQPSAVGNLLGITAFIQCLPTHLLTCRFPPR